MRGLQKDMPPSSPWHYAEKAGRRHLTPEDVRAALKVGGQRFEVWVAVLQAIEGRAVEEAALCAFTALRGPPPEGWGPEAPRHLSKTSAKALMWFARGGGIAKMGPYTRQCEAAQALRDAGGNLLPNALLWPEEVEVSLKTPPTKKIPAKNRGAARTRR